jgi:arginine-tRNA-protein transferase
MADQAPERIPVYASPPHPCPYLPGRTALSHFLQAPPGSGAWYEKLISERWRRSGGIYYQPNCPGCRLCLPIRIPVASFKPSPSQARTLRRNADLTVILGPDLADPEALALYGRHQTGWHGAETEPTPEDSREFLGKSPVDSVLMLYRLDGVLLGAGWVDLLEDSLSSVYFAFEPAAAKRRLGVFSLLKEIELARNLGKAWLQLGFWVPGCPTMDYKSGYRPHEVLAGGRWTDAPDLAAVPGFSPPDPGSDAAAGPG